MKTFHYQFQEKYMKVKITLMRQWHDVSTLLWVTTQSSHWLQSPLKIQPLHPTPLAPAVPLPIHQPCSPLLAKTRPLQVNFSRAGGGLSMWSSLALRWLSFWRIFHEKALEFHLGIFNEQNKLISWVGSGGQCPLDTLDLIFSGRTHADNFLRWTPLRSTWGRRQIWSTTTFLSRRPTPIKETRNPFFGRD